MMFQHLNHCNKYLLTDILIVCNNLKNHNKMNNHHLKNIIHIDNQYLLWIIKYKIP